MIDHANYRARLIIRNAEHHAREAAKAAEAAAAKSMVEEQTRLSLHALNLHDPSESE